ncbi:MAG: hypothetical protein WCK02_04785 [Bacteroidota bacterium]
MKLKHKFLNELELLEEKQEFCGRKIKNKCNILIIGTFNPDNESCLKENEASWFYGRDKSWFWKYLPENIIGTNLHENGSVDVWKNFCREHNIIIVDLIKSFEAQSKLVDFKDSSIDVSINEKSSNTAIFDFNRAFDGITFEKVIYTRKGWEPNKNKDIPCLIKIKDDTNNILLQNGIICSESQIKYCPAPWQKRKSTSLQWEIAIKN